MLALSNHWHLASVMRFLMDEGLLSIISADCGQLVKMLITLERHGIFRSNFAYLFYFNIVQSLVCRSMSLCENALNS